MDKTINAYLMAEEEQSLELLYHLLYAKENEQRIQKDNNLFILQFMSYIWKLEKKEYGQSTIFAGVKDIEGAVNRYQYIKFAVRRIEQLMPKEICMQTTKQLIAMQVSGLALFCVIKKDVRKSYQTLCLMAAYLEQLGEMKHCQKLLRLAGNTTFQPYELEALKDDGEVEEEQKMLQNVNPKKNHSFCFILCSNQELFVEECLLYIGQLIVPEGWKVETLTVWEADSMTAGYNEGMQASAAEIKIYLHQDVFIRNRLFLLDLVKIFETDPEIGIIGVVGSVKLPEDGTMWHGPRVGEIYASIEVETKSVGNHLEPVRENYTQVEALDGLLLATRVDIPFREDLFTDWDFYDISACMEFRRKGFKVVTAGQKSPWCIHDCGTANLVNYEKNRAVFLKEYAGEF